MQNLAALTLYFVVLMSLAGLVAVVAGTALLVSGVRSRRALATAADRVVQRRRRLRLSHQH